MAGPGNSAAEVAISPKGFASPPLPDATAPVSPSAAMEWRTYWPLVLASGVGFSLQSVSTYSLGLAMEPLGEEFGWGRAQISVVSLIPAVLMILFSPSTGALVDRRGCRWLAIPSIALTGMALAMISLASGSMLQWAILWTIYGVVSLGIKATVWTTAVSNTFTTGRGLALGVMLTGAALSQIGVPPLMQWLVDGFGWRTAYVAIGLGWSTPALVLALLFLRDGHSTKSREPAAARNVSPQDRAALPGLTFRKALRSPALIRIAASTLLTMFIGTAMLVHQVPILTDAGLSRSNAAWLASLAGVAGIVGKMVTGWMTDKWDASIVGSTLLLSPAIAYLMLLAPQPSPLTMVLAMAIIGYTAGAKLQISAYLTALHAGMRNFGTIFGVMTSMIGIGGGLGSVGAGAVFDYFGSYHPLLVLGIAISLASSALIFRLGKPKI
ncbi:MAG: MFS transporter [Novosphingobium sp.]